MAVGSVHGNSWVEHIDPKTWNTKCGAQHGMSQKRRQMTNLCLVWGPKGRIANSLKVLGFEIKDRRLTSFVVNVSDHRH